MNDLPIYCGTHLIAILAAAVLTYHSPRTPILSLNMKPSIGQSTFWISWAMLSKKPPQKHQYQVLILQHKRNNFYSIIRPIFRWKIFQMSWWSIGITRKLIMCQSVTGRWQQKVQNGWKLLGWVIRQLIAVFAASLVGDFLPPQIIYTRKTLCCLPIMKFPEYWDITFTQNHWVNEKTTEAHIIKILVPYIEICRKSYLLPQIMQLLSYLTGSKVSVHQI